LNAFTASTLNLSMQTGCGPLSDTEAAKFAAYLTDQLPATDPQDQHVVLHLIHGLREVPKHEAAFGDLYRMPGALPGWIPDP
jgi:hypothetical protein